jgi:uncharacterized Ntn-hydrolase superfamily protein
VTFSIAARCARTGMVGVAISSSSPAVASRCAYVRAGAGAACSQNVTDPRLGPRLLDLMESGLAAEDAIGAVTRTEPQIRYRQLTAVGTAGRPAVYSGAGTLGICGSAVSDDSAAAGNLLADRGVPGAMIHSFTENADADLPERLVRALSAGLHAGGEAGPVRSAGLLVAGQVPWPIADLRVDWHDDPVGELRVLWELWRPQMTDYVTRALNPAAAPGYGVPGDP